MEENDKKLMDYALKATTENKLLEIVSASFSGPQQNLIGNITIWHPEGVDLNMCEQLSHILNEMLDIDDPFDFHYTLEVSSMSLTRKLKIEEDFRRSIGENIKIKFIDKEKNDIDGRLINHNKTEFTIEKSGKEVSFPYCDIKQATINF